MLKLLIEDFIKSLSHNTNHPLYSGTGEKANPCAKGELSSILNDMECLKAHPETRGLNKLIKRLKEPEEFAGAREELEVAAHFKRNGFENLILKDCNKEVPSSDIELPLEPSIFIECYLQQYPEKEKELDERLAQGDLTKAELTDEEVETLINYRIKDKFKQLEESKDKPVIIILDFSYSEPYERVAKKILDEINPPSFISCILIRTKSNAIFYNKSFNNEKIKETLYSLPMPTDRASSLWQKPRLY